MAERPKEWVYGRPLAGIAGSYPAGGMDASRLWTLCYRVEVSAKGRSLLQMGPTECGVSNWNLEDEEA